MRLDAEHTLVPDIVLWLAGQQADKAIERRRIDGIEHGLGGPFALAEPFEQTPPPGIGQQVDERQARFEFQRMPAVGGGQEDALARYSSCTKAYWRGVLPLCSMTSLQNTQSKAPSA